MVYMEEGEGVDAELDREFDMLINSTTTTNATITLNTNTTTNTTSRAPSDRVVQAKVWRLQLQKKKATFEFLIRKHGLQ